MIDLILALLMATCNLGAPIDHWAEYVETNVLRDLTASVRYQDSAGVRWLWVFDNHVLFLTGVDTEHGVCARELPTGTNGRWH